ncbi:BrnA antitoxin family protein [Pusillimonas sp.]|uniref:BrnA antitoxin family protein n=1 Tax=Pusillimonas sp. TaxID=3040095 RepID=UPI0037CABDEA
MLMPNTTKPLIDHDGEVRELTEEDMKKFRPAAAVLPGRLQAKLGMRRRGPQKGPTKERITIRLSADVIKNFRATGPGWQSRIDSALQDWLKNHPQ